ncbi:Zinc finger, PMZ-type [Sesbania bispinosa]|nr:Zinc finger, PMZ-type [Sesbania bispinosa]
MATRKVIAICQSGGEFVSNKDGSLSYNGGEAYAIDIDQQTSLSDFKSEIAEMFNCNVNTMIIKYFLPGNKKTLITVSKDKDLQRMVSFLGDASTVDVFVMSEEGAARNISNMPGSRSSRTTVSEAIVPVVAPVDVIADAAQSIEQVEMDVANEAPANSICSGANDDKHYKAALQWENTITGVDQRFNSFAEFREALHKYSIAHGFAYRYKKNDSHRVTVKYFQNGLKKSLSEVFEKCYHSYCLRHLAEKLNKDLKGQFSHEARRFMINDFYAAAHAPKLETFDRSIENIKGISPEAYNWVIQSEPEHWANAFFNGARYNHLTSNFGQQFYSWVSEAHELPITQMIDVLRGKMMEAIYTRREESNQWMTKLTPSKEEIIQKETSVARSFQVLLSQGNTNTFEVRGESVDIVDIDHWDCSCKGWQLTGLPCCHAIAVFECIGRSPYDYCSRYFTVDNYRLTYAETIHPVPNVDRPVQGESLAITVTPPPTKRPPGRPKMKQVESIDIIKRQLQCSKCKGLGHNRKTCKLS